MSRNAGAVVELPTVETQGRGSEVLASWRSSPGSRTGKRAPMSQRRRTGPAGRAAPVRRWLASGALVIAVAGTSTAGTVATLAATGSRAGAAAIGDCTTTSGVIVVVDFQHFGGTVERGCGSDPSPGSTTGLDAMHTAGFKTAGTAEYGTAFICRITDPATQVYEPSTTATSCNSTPPASAYWSYWHADVGQTTWSYSELGAASYKPPPGSVTLWVFGGTSVTGGAGTGRPPATLTPTSLRGPAGAPPAGGTTTTTTGPTPTTSPPSAGGTGGTAPASGAAGAASTSGGSGHPSSSASGSGGGSGSATTPAVAASGSTTTTAPGKDESGTSTAKGGRDRSAGGGGSRAGHRARAAPKIVDVSQGSHRATSGSGSPLPLIVGAVVVVALAGTGAAIAWRRRRTGQAG